MAYTSQLLASLADLNEMGPTVEAMAPKTLVQKTRALRAASAILISYIRSRYTPPLTVIVEETDATTGLNATFSGTPSGAMSLAVRIDAPGGTVGNAIPISWSTDGGTTYPNTGTLDTSGIFTLDGFTITFTGTLTTGAIASASAGVDWAIRQHVVNVAAYNLVYNRGVDPESTDGKALQKRYDDAKLWALDVQSEKAKLDEGSDATPNKRETRPRGGGQTNSWDWMDVV